MVAEVEDVVAEEDGAVVEDIPAVEGGTEEVVIAGNRIFLRFNSRLALSLVLISPLDK